MNDILLSFIIPAHNAENYIIRCINSILAIGNDNYEIIVVDDGSTDHTLDMLRRLDCQQLIIYSQNNLGVSAARNTGLKIAKGKYVMFVDSDDEIIDCSFSNVFNLLNLGNDCYMFAFIKQYIDCCDCVVPPFAEGIHDVFDIAKIQDMLLDFKYSKTYESKYLGGKVYQYLIKKDFLQNRNIYFSENLSYGEDLCFVLSLLGSLNEIFVSHIEIYCWYYNPGSTMHTFNPDFWSNWKKVFDNINKCYKNKFDLNKLILCNAYGSISHYLEYLTLKNCKLIENRISEVINDPIVEYSLNELKNSNWTDDEKLINKNILKKNTLFFLVTEYKNKILRKIYTLISNKTANWRLEK